MLRVIKELRPAWVVGENVAGIINMALDQVLSDLEAQGYETRTFVIPACGVDAPHRRDRVAIISYNNAIRRSVRGSERKRIYRDKTRNETDSGGSDVADAERIGLRKNSNQSAYNEKRDGPAYGKKRKTKLCEAGCGSSAVSNPAGTGFQNRTSGAFFRPEEEQKPERSDWWPIEPDVGRVAHGIPHRVDRLRCLGNAVVPAQFYPIFKGIAELFGREVQK
jgi:DNA (cytosine-5)-methyltransferase 1